MTHRRTRSLNFVLRVAVLVAARAALADSGPLDVESAVRSALEMNPQLRARRLELGIAEGRLRQAGVASNPEIEIERPAEKGVDVEIRAEMDATTLLFLPARREVAALELESARHRVAEAAIELAHDVRVAFHRAVWANRRAALAEESLEIAAATRDGAFALHEAGNVPELDLKTAVAAHERARLDVTAAELEVALASEGLARLLGSSLVVASELVADDEDAPETPAVPGAAEAKALAANLELAALRTSLAAGTRRASLIRREGLVPDTSLYVISSRAASEPGSHGAVGAADGRWSWGAGIKVRLPLFDRKQGVTRSNQAEVEVLRARLDGSSLGLASEVREATSRVVLSHARARQLGQVVVPARRAVLDETLLHYNAMQAGVFQLLAARRSVLDAELEEAAARRDYRIAVARLDALVAGGRPESFSSTETTDGGH